MKADIQNLTLGFDLKLRFTIFFCCISYVFHKIWNWYKVTLIVSNIELGSAITIYLAIPQYQLFWIKVPSF